MSRSSSAKPSKRAAQKAETRKRLVDVAIEVFSESDYEQVAVADIAARADVAHGLLFHYFGNKRGIYLEAVRTTADQLNAAFVFRPGSTPRELVRTALRQHLEYLREHRGLALRLVLGGRGADPQAWEVYEAARWTALAAFAAVMGLDRDNPALRMVGRAAVSALDESTVQWLDNTDAFDVDHMVRWMESLIVACIQTAHVLDPGIDLDGAVALLE
ncbi:TetR/AcrR family transcriptional regulator [Williamsia herbipolensis]|uniref:TetR/AcrR family transcriptional regulator n=1 Tax=Williamsia herbipolensis TaxID=1603258 RepID=UPI0005F7F0EC|nr:TetR/AcrR family transcriptional regulator [Williamsia herbipolensis]